MFLFPVLSPSRWRPAAANSKAPSADLESRPGGRLRPTGKRPPLRAGQWHRATAPHHRPGCRSLPRRTRRRPEARPRDRAGVGLLTPYFVGKPLGELAEVAAAYTREHRAELAPATIRNRLRYLTSACRWAWKHCAMGDRDPAAPVVMPTVSNERQVYVYRGRCCAGPRVRRQARQGGDPDRLLLRHAAGRDRARRARFTAGAFLLETRRTASRASSRCIRASALCRYPARKELSDRLPLPQSADSGRPEPVRFPRLAPFGRAACWPKACRCNTVGAILGHKSGATPGDTPTTPPQSLREAVGRIGKRA